MTVSITRNASFTITDARYVGAKVGTDLRLLNNLYGKPALADIPNYVEEVALLLKNGYLDTVDYGFRKQDGESWLLRLRYRATTGGQLLDTRPGSLPTSVAVSGLSFYSYLTYSRSFHSLNATERSSFEDGLPFQRTGAPEPTASSGTTTNGNGYSRAGSGVTRDIYLAL
ncbi:hypothetical protein [Actinospica robiniae]|uniref:HORMA-1 domain-containing protein n=1 Tax=Actinospica robiniae TaxID=304901 RepID=UPI000412E74A|nr:hypothetical protein [Actinospica robiniae]